MCVNGIKTVGKHVSIWRQQFANVVVATQSNATYRFCHVWRKRYIQSGAAYHVSSRVSHISTIAIHARLVAFHFSSRSQNYTNSPTISEVGARTEKQMETNQNRGLRFWLNLTRFIFLFRACYWILHFLRKGRWLNLWWACCLNLSIHITNTMAKVCLYGVHVLVGLYQKP